MLKSIRTKIVLTLLILLTAVVAIQAVRFFISEKQLAHQRAEIFRAKTAQDWALACEQNYRTKKRGVDWTFRETHNSPTLVAAACYTKTGSAFSALSPEKLEQPLTAGEIRYMDKVLSGSIKTAPHNPSAELIISDMPVNVFPEGKILARIYFSKTHEQEELVRQFRLAATKIYGGSAIALVTAYVAILLLSLIFVRPIDEITRGAREIARGNLKYRIKADRSDELGQIASELNEMAAKLAELEKLKDDFTSGITHDLRSPVTGIKLAAGNIIKEYEAGKISRIPEQVFIIEENTARLNRLIDMILQVAKIESGKESLSIKLTNVEELLSDIIKANRPYAKEKHLTLDLIVENNSAEIPADPEKLEQALSNIITNALKHTDSGSVLVYIKRADSEIRIQVKDTGTGIEPEHQKFIFEKFQKGGRPRGKGSGLGLYLAKKIIELHSGSISFSSEPGKGTEFTVALPLVQDSGQNA